MKKFSEEDILNYLEGTPNSKIDTSLKTDEDLKKTVAQYQEMFELMSATEEYSPSESVLQNIRESVLEEKTNNDTNKGIGWMQIAAAVSLLIIGFLAGTLLNSTPDNSDQLAALMDGVMLLKESTIQASLKTYSASERIMAVNQIQYRKSINADLLATLIHTLNTDESPNVRYEALQALNNFIDDHVVRAELVKSLETQTDPLIQISLITILVNANEYGVKTPLKNIIQNERTSEQVKQQAELAIQILS